MNESQAVLVPLVQFQVYCNGTSQWFASEAKRLSVCGSFNPLEGETVPLIRHGDTVGVSVGVCVAVGVSVGIAVGVGVKIVVGVKVSIGLTVLVGLGVLLGLAAASTLIGALLKYDINNSTIVITRLDLNTNVFIRYSSMNTRNVIRVVQDTILRVVLHSRK